MHARVRREVHLILLALSAVAAVGCGTASAAEDGAPLPSFTRVAAADVRPLELVRVRHVDLGATGQRVSQLVDIVLHGERVFALDGVATAVRVYDTSGRHVRSFGKKGFEPNEFDDPYRLMVHGANIRVLDLGQTSVIPEFDTTGAHVGGVRWENERMPTDAAEMTAGLAVSTTVSATPGQQRDIVKIIDARGTSVGTGCRIDPRILESERRRGMIGAMVFARVETLGDRIYCSQATTPVVQVLDRTGTVVDSITIAPPFYTPPTDMPLTTNAKKALAFSATFTTHAGLTPTPSGFVSLYSRHDEGSGQSLNLLFACDSAAGVRRCGTVSTSRRVLRIVTPDTIVLQEQVPPGAPIRVGVYRLVGLTAR